MKLYIKFLLLIVVLGVSGLFVLKRPDGKPWLDVETFIPDFKRQLAAFLSAKQRVTEQFNDLKPGPEDSNVTVYKWRDAQGQWMYSDTPPDSGQSEIIVVNTNTNVVRSTPVPDRSVEQASQGSVTLLSSGDDKEDAESSSLKGGLDNVLGDAKKVQGLLDQRKARQDQQVDL